MSELIKIDSTPAILTADFDAAKLRLAQELEKYKIVVTSDTVKSAKELATRLNKDSNHLDELRKKTIGDVSAPIKQFDTNMKELVSMCQDGRQDILSQVLEFENVTRAKVRELLSDLLKLHYIEHNVREEFRSVNIDDMILLSNLTTKQNLTGQAKKDLESRVIADKARQATIDMRLANLEAESLKAGLTTVLERHHVEAFLHADDNTYKHKVQEVIDKELKRQAAVEQATEKKIADQKAAEKPQPTEPVDAPQKPDNTQAQASPQPAAPSVSRGTVADGLESWNLTVRFNVETKSGIKPEAIESRLRDLLSGVLTSEFTIEVSHAT